VEARRKWRQRWTSTVSWKLWSARFVMSCTMIREFCRVGTVAALPALKPGDAADNRRYRDCLVRYVGKTLLCLASCRKTSSLWISWRRWKSMWVSIFPRWLRIGNVCDMPRGRVSDWHRFSYHNFHSLINVKVVKFYGLRNTLYIHFYTVMTRCITALISQ